VTVDHRALGWEPLANDDIRPWYESFFAVSPDARWHVDEVLACDDRVIAQLVTFHGRSNDGGDGAPAGAS
jgi:hypothetical protein